MTINGHSGPFQAREWVLITFGMCLITWEAVWEHSAHREVFAVGLIILGVVPWSIAERLLAGRVYPNGNGRRPSKEG